MTSRGDALLYVASHRRSLSWSTYKQAFDTLVAESLVTHGTAESEIDIVRSRTVRAMDSLGHWDVTFSGGSGIIQIAPPTIIRVPYAGLPQAVLAGSRSPATVTSIRNTAKRADIHAAIEVKQQESSLSASPSLISLQADSDEHLLRLAASMKVVFHREPVAWAVATNNGSITDYMARLDWLAQPEPNWPRRDFDAEQLSFGPKGPTQGLRLSSYQNPVSTLLVHMLWDEEGRCARVDRDWGRYIVLHARGVAVIGFDRLRMLCILPDPVPLPRLYARALTLCSGVVPQFGVDSVAMKSCRPDRSFTVYRGVPDDVAERVAESLGQTLVATAVDQSRKGE